MNTECIITTKENRNQKKQLETIRAYIEKLSNEIELYPVALSKITKETKCYKTYDESHGYTQKGKKTILFPDDLVLFVAGKYRYMNKTTLNRYATKDEKNALSGIVVLFPQAETTFFEDITTY